MAAGAPAGASAAGPGLDHFIYAERGLQFALPVVDVLEIIDLPSLLPSQPGVPGCVGNVLHRDFLVPVIDSAVLGSHAQPASQAPKTAIIVQHAGTLFGLTIERHVAVAAITGGPSEPRAAAPGLDHEAAVNPFVQAVRAFRGDLMIVFAIPALAAAIRRVAGDQRTVAEPGAQVDRGLEHEVERREFLCAALERIALAIPVASVLEVIEDHDVTPLFNVHPILRGLINLRGQVLACLDISAELELPPRVIEERNQFVIMHAGGAELALCVDRIGGIRALPWDRVQSTDAALAGSMTRYFDGVLESEDGPILFLSVPSLFDSPHLQPYRSHDG